MREGHQPTDVPAVVFLHGLFGHAGDFDTVGALIPPRFPVFTPELPIATGLGNEEEVDGLVSWLERRLDAEGIRRAVLVGNSLGGHVALSYALAHPGRVAGLVLAGSSGLFERGLETAVPRRPTRDWVRRKIGEIFFDPDLVSDQLVEEAHAVLADRKRYGSVLRLARDAKQRNLAAELPRVTARTLLLWGDADRITPPEVAREFASRIPGARLLFLTACGHAPTLERPSFFAFHVAAFLNDLCPELAVSDRVREEAA